MSKGEHVELEVGEIDNDRNDNSGSRRLWAFERPPREYRRNRCHPVCFSDRRNVEGCGENSNSRSANGTKEQTTQLEPVVIIVDYFDSKRGETR